MCGLGGMASALSAKVQSVLLHHRKSSGNKDDERRGSSQDNRVIPPEPVQSMPEGDFTQHEVGPALSEHNLARANKGSKKLEWDNRLMRDAEIYAKQLAELGSLEPSGVEDEGENIFMSQGDAALQDAVKGWLSEESKYTAQIVAGGNFDDCSQYTQCIWNTTKRVGMGKAKSKNGRTFIVARYSPRGNVEGGRPF